MKNKKTSENRSYKTFFLRMLFFESQCTAFTLVEVVLVAALIGILAVALAPSIARGMRYRTTRDVAQKFQQAVLAFEEYYSDKGKWPNNAGPGVIPSEMTGANAYYFAANGIDWWEENPTGIGGRWDWDNYSHLGAYISIANPTAEDEKLLALDRILDDGSLTSGKFQKGVNTYYANDYSFIIDL